MKVSNAWPFNAIFWVLLGIVVARVFHVGAVSQTSGGVAVALLGAWIVFLHPRYTNAER